MDDFMLRALLGGGIIALVSGPLGSFIVWRRMAYFGDTLAHSALLGVALGILFEVNITLAIVVVCLLLAVILVLLQQQRHMASDTLLGILSHSTLSLGLVVLALMDEIRIDLIGYLFGDILAISLNDIYWIGAAGALSLAILGFIWRDLLRITVHEEMAQVEGVPVMAIRLTFMLVIAILIAVAMKVVGILLITSLLIIPAATASHLARTPEQMALYASLLGMLAVGGGLLSSLQWDLPAGPAVVLCAALVFFSGSLLTRLLVNR